VKLIETGIPGLVIIQPVVHGDDRGYFMETWNAERYSALGLPDQFVQANVSRSAAGVIRGLHYQHPNPQGKLVSVLDGQVFDVAVDIRSNSPTFGQWAGVELSAHNHRQLYVPEGFAHGFCVLGESALLAYMVTAPFRAEHDSVIAWDDPDIGIDWPLKPESLSAKDRDAPQLKHVKPADLPQFHP
jgi:dTDP-4-dehydrorhamnose 3,5-epimerase